MKYWKSITGIFFVGIVVALLISYRSSWISDSKPTSTDSGETAQDIPEVFVTQVSRAVRFQYSTSYILTEKEVGNAERTHYVITLVKASDAQNGDKENSEGPRAITFDFYQNKEKFTPEQWVKQSAFSNFKLSPDGKLEQIPFAGGSAVSYRWDGLYSGQSLVTTTSGDILMISVTYDGDSDKRLEDYKKLLSTVEFIGIVR